MAGDKRTKDQRLKDRETIAELKLKQRPVVEIMQVTGLSRATVQRELAILRQEWKEKANEAIDDIVARELAKLDIVEKEALEGWQRSRQDFTSRTVTESPKGARGGGGRTATLNTQTQNGDPRFLSVLLTIQDRRAKLLGMDKPQKVAPTNPEGTEPYKPMTDAELDKRIAELSAKVGHGDQ